MKNKTYKPKTIQEAINLLEGFFIVDMWYAKSLEWKNEDMMIKYIRDHFNLLKKEIKNIERRSNLKNKNGI